MTFLQEAKLRWGTGVPPFFTKVQKLCGAAATLGTAIAGVSIFSTGKLNWVGIAGGSLAAIATGAGFVAQFVVTTAGIILEPGDSIQNQSQTTVEVKPADPPISAPN